MTMFRNPKKLKLFCIVLEEVSVGRSAVMAKKEAKPKETSGFKNFGLGPFRHKLGLDHFLHFD